MLDDNFFTFSVQKRPVEWVAVSIDLAHSYQMAEES